MPYQYPREITERKKQKTNIQNNLKAIDFTILLA
jgi:hypothetical protein